MKHAKFFFLTLSHTQSGRGGRGIKLLTLSNPKQKYLQPYISLFIYNKHICLPYFILTATHIFVTRTSDIQRSLLNVLNLTKIFVLYEASKSSSRVSFCI